MAPSFWDTRAGRLLALAVIALAVAVAGLACGADVRPDLVGPALEGASDR
jgi:hypothetical protein